MDILKIKMASTVREVLENAMPSTLSHQANFYKISIRPTEGLDVGEFVIRTAQGPRHFSVRLKESW